MTQKVYITEPQDITLFRTRSGKSVHIQHGVVHRDLLDQTVSKVELDRIATSMIGWMLYERLHAICGQYSASGFSDYERGAVGWCPDDELCLRCMSALDDDQRVVLFSELTSREDPDRNLNLISIARQFHG